MSCSLLLANTFAKHKTLDLLARDGDQSEHREGSQVPVLRQGDDHVRRILPQCVICRCVRGQTAHISSTKQ